MNDEELSSRDEDDLERLAGALGYEPQREPPPTRVAAIRAAADELRRTQQTEGRAERRHRERRTVSQMPRRRELLIGGIAASVGAVAGLAGRELLADGPPEVPTEPIAFTGAPSGVQTDARLINHTWGTELLLDVSGLTDGEAYRVTYLDPSGTLTDAGSFVGVADVLMVCRFNAAPLRAEVAAIAVVDTSGAEVMRADLA